MDPEIFEDQREQLRKKHLANLVEKTNTALKACKAQYDADVALLTDGRTSDITPNGHDGTTVESHESAGVSDRLSSIEGMLPMFGRVFGFEKLYPVQEKAIKANLAGRDIVLVTATGGGKSLTYQLPAIVSPGMTLVISPLLSLIMDQLRALTLAKVNAVSYVSDTPPETKRHIRAVLCAMAEGRLTTGPRVIKICYVAPERIVQDKSFKVLISALARSKMLARIIVDEAQCVTQMGDSFRPNYLCLNSLRRTLCPRVPIMAVTATCRPSVMNGMLRILEMNDVNHDSLPPTVVLRTSSRRPNLEYQVLLKPPRMAAFDALIVSHISNKFAGESGIVYCRTRAQAERVAATLRDLSKNKIVAAAFHAGLNGQEREAAFKDWHEGKIHVMCATIAFGLGINKANVRFVMHHSMPTTLDAFYQESGRAGRDGKPASCIIYYRVQDASNVGKHINPGETGMTDYKNMLTFAQDLINCRQVHLSRYLSDDKTLFNSSSALGDCEPCKKCDNCMRDQKSFEKRDVTAVVWRLLHILKQLETQGHKPTIKGLSELSHGFSTIKNVCIGRKRQNSGGAIMVNLVPIEGKSEGITIEHTGRLIIQLIVDEYIEAATRCSGPLSLVMRIKLGPLAHQFTSRSLEELAEHRITQCLDLTVNRGPGRLNAAGISTGSAPLNDEDESESEEALSAEELDEMRQLIDDCGGDQGYKREGGADSPPTKKRKTAQLAPAKRISRLQVIKRQPSRWLRPKEPSRHSMATRSRKSG